MRVPRAAITSAFDASDPPLPSLRRIFREAGADVLRRARKLPPSWRRFVRSKRFTRSRLWSRLRYDFLRDHDGRCQCCGRGAPDGDKLNVDHVLSRKTYPQFALAYANLQVLCSTCNQGKGNRDRTDWRFRAPNKKQKIRTAITKPEKRPTTPRCQRGRGCRKRFQFRKCSKKVRLAQRPIASRGFNPWRRGH